MNLVLDDAFEISTKKQTKKELGILTRMHALMYSWLVRIVSLGRIMLKGDTICLIMNKATAADTA